MLVHYKIKRLENINPIEKSIKYLPLMPGGVLDESCLIAEGISTVLASAVEVSLMLSGNKKKQ